MSSAISGHGIGQELEAVGLLPPECCDIRVDLPVDGAVQMTYTVNLTGDDMAKFAQALKLYVKRQFNIDLPDAYDVKRGIALAGVPQGAKSLTVVNPQP